jgi:hypothetical protein
MAGLAQSRHEHRIRATTNLYDPTSSPQQSQGRGSMTVAHCPTLPSPVVMDLCAAKRGMGVGFGARFYSHQEDRERHQLWSIAWQILRRFVTGEKEEDPQCPPDRWGACDSERRQFRAGGGCAGGPACRRATHGGVATNLRAPVVGECFRCCICAM